ncbi:MAG: RsmB/NOP family class I SAM-dependent RNA methyltransferase [Crenarchaeota archaeon]|nr:RsmB/NOP family class I SAM-dependent RNA methyltransferase [Thermoproteota archaeon]
MRAVLRYDAGVVECLRRVYGDDYRRFLEAIAVPSRRLYVRVNTLRVDPRELADSLRARGIAVGIDEFLPEALYFPVEGPFSVEDLDLRVHVDKYAAESVYMGAHLYVPGVVSCDDSISRGSEVSIVGPGGVVVANGVAEMSCSEMMERSKGLAVRVYRSVFRAPPIRELEEFRNGLIYPQSLPAMYVSRVLDPRPGEVIVDMCAAPGGKTSHIVELSGGRARVIAFDHSRSKIRELIENLRRLGHADKVSVHRADSRYLSVDFPWLRADKVLVDPPCSALGVRPKLYDEKTRRDIEVCSEYQKQFLREAIRIVKPGGVVVYSVCTVTIEEGEDVVSSVARELGCVEVERVEVPRASSGIGIPAARFHPHVHDTPGFFIARLRRTCA